MKGASTWLSVLQIAQHGFDLHKSAFRDALCLGCGWQLQNIPHPCSCGSRFTVDHVMTCLKGCFFLQHRGMAKESTTFYQKLASLTAEKTSQPYSSVMEWMRCCLSFVFLRTSILCIHGTRSSVFEPRGQFDPRGQFNPQGQFNPRGQFDTR